MTKTPLFLMILATALTSLAHAAAPQVDCSKALAKVDAQVVIKSTGASIDAEAAAKLAFACFAKAPTVANEISSTLKFVRDDVSQTQCGLGELKTFELGSWVSERVYGHRDDATGKTTGTTGGEYKILVAQTIDCAGVGSGMYAGTAATVALQMKVSTSSSYNMDDETVPVEQTVTVTEPALLKLPQGTN